ncbi:MAG TPA: SDR family oxidoreductase [bacterium]|nr:SDR family oxidoreductase [bacterium]
MQFGPKHIRTNAIAPGPIETPLLTSWLLDNPDAKQLRLNRIPMGRFGRP